MLKEKPPTLSVEQKAVSPRLPHAPLRTSAALGWRGIQVQHHRQPAWSMPEYRPFQHILVVYHSGHDTRLERTVDGHRQSEQAHDGSVAIVPAQVLYQASWDRAIDVTLIFLEPIHLAQIAPEAIDGDRVELLPRFVQRDPFLYGLGLALNALIHANGTNDRLYAESLLTVLPLHLLRHYCTRPPQLPAVSGGLSPSKLKHAIDYMHTHLTEDLSLDAIAAEVGISASYFCRLFKRSIGIAPHRYLIQQRVERAKQLLQESGMTIAEIAYECGFGDHSHFTTHFRKFTGMTPTAYRQH